LALDAEAISAYVDDLEKECNIIKENAMSLTWAMRGGIQYNDCLNLSAAERDMIAKLSKENMKTTEKSGLPYF